MSLPRALTVLLLGPILAGAAEARLRPGASAPEFALRSSAGETVQLAEERGRRTVVLLFYAKAFTSGATRDLVALRDAHAEFQARDVRVFGVSTNTADDQRVFAEALRLPFPLLSDPDGAVARAYGVLADGYARRTVFVVDRAGTVKVASDGKDALRDALREVER